MLGGHHHEGGERADASQCMCADATRSVEHVEIAVGSLLTEMGKKRSGHEDRWRRDLPSLDPLRIVVNMLGSHWALHAQELPRAVLAPVHRLSNRRPVFPVE